MLPAGHGDVLRPHSTRWGGNGMGIAARLEGVDLNPWRHARRGARRDTRYGADQLPHRECLCVRAGEMMASIFIISSQFTHHLSDGPDRDVHPLDGGRMHGAVGFIGDLHRHWFPYYGFGAVGVGRAPGIIFVLSDGRISIARSFVPDDWHRLVHAAGLTDEDCRDHLAYAVPSFALRDVVRSTDYRWRAGWRHRRHFAGASGLPRVHADRAQRRARRQGMRRFSSVPKQSR